MPSILAHYIFLDEAEKNLLPIANIGAQGPDPFFFNNVTLKQSEQNKKVTTVGHFLHNIDPMKTFEYIINYIKNAHDSEKDILIDYFKGMLAHYSLDSVCHPYIFYLSGFVTDDPENSNNYFLAHTAIETQIDAKLRDFYKCKKPAYKTLKVDNFSLEVVSRMINGYLKDVWNFDYVEADSFYKAVKRMKCCYHFMYSKHGIKKWMFQHSPLKLTTVNILSMPTSKKIINLDFLNLKHNLFVDCVTGKNPRTCTFYDLFDEAIDKYYLLRDCFYGILNGTSSFDDMAKITNNIDHDGKPVGSKMKYFKLIWNELYQ